jgi:peptidoglycan/LPS O-acetylase OafA/YrhL
MRQMPLTCNIDARGKRARLINGLVLLAIGLLAAAYALFAANSQIAWIVAAVCLPLGGFCVFEARAGWCVLRAMGIKTKM